MVSVIGDFYKDKWMPQPWFEKPTVYIPEISRSEFEALLKEVLELKELLKRAKAYDEKTNQLDCEMENKISLLREVAKAVGVDLDSILKPQSI